MNVLVTGGAGYIGSHAALKLLEQGHRVTVLDDLSRGHRGAIEVLEAQGDLGFVEGDFGDGTLLREILGDRAIEVVMHFAALALVPESVEQPLRYWANNTAKAVTLLEAMAAAGVRKMVFSSTAATYGAPGADRIPIDETCPQRPINPYGRTKLAVERMLRDEASAGDLAFATLRYFNVAGCDRVGRLGEDHDPETHLIPLCLDAALELRDGLTIFGTDYPTADGTCVRDYVHVEDLADAHLLAMDALTPGEGKAYNVGIGRGYSVREVVEAAQRVTGVSFPVAEGDRRAGDPPVLYADAQKIRRELGFEPQVTELEEIVASAWRWRKAHTHGY
jgi:UDP-glucose 4-epimerase